MVGVLQRTEGGERRCETGRDRSPSWKRGRRDRRRGPKRRIEPVSLDPRAIGQRVRDARKGWGWTIEELGDVAGLAKNTVAAIECGSRIPSRESAIVLALALRRKLDWLLLGKRQMR